MKSRSRLAIAASLLLACPIPSPACEAPGLWHIEAVQEIGAPISTVAVWQAAATPPANPAVDFAVDPGSIEATEEPEAKVNVAGDHRSVADFERYESNGVAHFALVYQPLDAREKLLPDVGGLAELTTAMGAQKTDGLVLADFEIFLVGGKSHCAALFREGAGTRTFEEEVTAADLTASLEQKKIIDFELVETGPGAPTFAVLYEAGPAGQLFFDLNGDDFHDKVHSLNPGDSRHPSYRLRDVETYLDAMGRSRYAAIFEKASGADHLFIQACAAGCATDPVLVQTRKDLMDTIAEKAADPTMQLQLIDLELPLGQSGGLKLAAAPALRPGSLPIAAKPDKIGPRPPGPVPPKWPRTHAGVLHDAGTDGPP